MDIDDCWGGALGPLGAPKGPLGAPRGLLGPPRAPWGSQGAPWGPKSIAMGAAQKKEPPTENLTFWKNHTFGDFLARNHFFVICWTSTATIRIGLLIVGQQYGIEDMYVHFTISGVEHRGKKS